MEEHLSVPFLCPAQCYLHMVRYVPLLSEHTFVPSLYSPIPRAPLTHATVFHSVHAMRPTCVEDRANENPECLLELKLS